jgi:hypothetical protein
LWLSWNWLQGRLSIFFNILYEILLFKQLLKGLFYFWADIHLWYDYSRYRLLLKLFQQWIVIHKISKWIRSRQAFSKGYVLHPNSIRSKNYSGIILEKNPNSKLSRLHSNKKYRKDIVKSTTKELKSMRKAYSKKKLLYNSRRTLKKRKKMDISSFLSLLIKAKLLKNWDSSDHSLRLLIN